VEETNATHFTLCALFSVPSVLRRAFFILLLTMGLVLIRLVYIIRNQSLSRLWGIQHFGRIDILKTQEIVLSWFSKL